MLYFCYSLRNINPEYLGSSTSDTNMTDALRNCEALSGTLTFGARISKIGIYGESGKPNKITGIRLTNSSSTFSGTSPQIDVSYNSMDATALNTLFGDLPTLTGKTIKITGNPGASTCDTSIATSKGWTVQN
jgi:hypothetical protein